MLWDSMINFFKSWFNYPGVGWGYMLGGIVLAIIFGGIWLLGLQPKVNKKPGLWAVAVVSAFLTLLAITFVQIPLQYYYGQLLESNISQRALLDWLLLAGIPTVLISGLVQEGAKMIPMVFWWQRSGRKIEPREGLLIGAMAGAGFGVFEAVWVHNQVFMAGWTWDVISIDWVNALIPFWDRLWVIAIHISVAALAGYGLAKGKGWQFYLLASVLHGVVNYFVLPFQKGLLTSNQVEIYTAVIGILVMLAVLWLRWRKDNEEPAMPVEEVAPTGLDTPAATDV
ncbi:MAG: hypothetical protein A2Y89_05260 [Chloroflexi bacterium RBG_13_51_18]|nr:MAG: hypothetical protein A2Y89_05260 [Chloroflexi bacterium RBG_13_51_18]